MGFGNFEVGAQCFPALTTVSVDAKQVGRRTGEYLLRLFDSPDAEQDKIVDLGFELLVRESTAPATRPTRKARAR